VSDAGQLDLTFTAALPARRIWTVRDLMAAVRTQLEREYGDVWIEGEISNFRPAGSGHLYFTLKDDGAQMQVVMFRSQARLLRFHPDNGLQVIARGRLTVYEARGEMQFAAEYLEPKGAGALQVAFEQLKAKLEAEGLFAVSRKKAIPALPRRVGVVTSARGAAIQDVLNVLRRRHAGLNVLLYPAQVQGEGAASEVATGVRWFNRARNVDVIIVARGGGSLEDLAAFNNEGLARTVASSQIPVISAVGHETDFTICDFVADLRAPTPSAAAELVVRAKQEIDEQLASLRQRLGRAARYQLLLKKQAWTGLAQHGALARMPHAIGRRQQRVDELVYRMADAYRARLQRYRQRLEVAEARVRAHDLRRVLSGMRRDLEARFARVTGAARTVLLRRRHRLQQASSRLEALSPLSILQRGYALVFDAAGNLVKDASQVEIGGEIQARVAKGTIAAEVKSRKI
jgi:exodeoxyribonuclease VII large subunit